MDLWSESRRMSYHVRAGEPAGAVFSRRSHRLRNGLNSISKFTNTPHTTTDTDSRAWPAIYGFPNKEGTGNFEKDPQWWNKTVSGVVNILDADDAGHRRMRRLQNPAFSDKALRAQESVICGYASLLVHKLHGLCSGGGGGGGGSAVVDMTAWYNFTTFGMLLS